MIRDIPVRQDWISPNRHPSIKDTGSLLDIIDSIRKVTGKPVGFKAMVGSHGWLSTMAEECQFGSRLHVLIGMHSGNEMQQEYLPDRHDDAQYEIAERIESSGQVAQGCKILQVPHA